MVYNTYLLTTKNDVNETLLPHRGIHYVITATTCLSPISCQEVGVPSVKAAAVATSTAKSSCTTECKVKLIAHFQYNYRVLNFELSDNHDKKQQLSVYDVFVPLGLNHVWIQ